jgi:hypothetical protein
VILRQGFKLVIFLFKADILSLCLTEFELAEVLTGFLVFSKAILTREVSEKVVRRGFFGTKASSFKLYLTLTSGFCSKA